MEFKVLQCISTRDGRFTKNNFYNIIKHYKPIGNSFRLGDDYRLIDDNGLIDNLPLNGNLWGFKLISFLYPDFLGHITKINNTKVEFDSLLILDTKSFINTFICLNQKS